MRVNSTGATALPLQSVTRSLQRHYLLFFALPPASYPASHHALASNLSFPIDGADSSPG
jgi:hypothetical protein